MQNAAVALFVLACTHFSACAQQGLLGEYFNNQDFTGARFSRVDPTINFDWVNGSPIAGIDVDSFTVRWTGEIVPLYSETYTFHVRSDDGERLWVNGQRICNGWSARLATTDTGSIALQAGQRYVIQLEYFEQTAGALVSLSWSSPSQPLQIVPASQLFPPSGSNRPPNSPILFVPQADNLTVDPEAFVPQTDAFSDPDSGQSHQCTEWEVWTVSPPERVWFSACANGTNLRAAALGNGVFENSHAGRTALRYFSQYLLRVRFKDSSGVGASEWSRWTERRFNTAQPLTTLVPSRSIWRYQDNGINQGTAWRGTNFNDSGWIQAAAQIGFGDSDEATTCCGARPTTVYFRRVVVLTNIAEFANVLVRLLRDDGGVVYVNGDEVFRSNMPAGVPAYSTLAASSVPEADETYVFHTGTFSPSRLRVGTNVVAVEIHQSSTTSGDLSFDLELLATLRIAEAGPTIIGQTPPAGALLTNLTQIALSFSAAVVGVDATDFLVNGLPATAVAGDGSNYLFSFSQPLSGPVNISWLPAHGITDRMSPPHPFNSVGFGASWTYTLDTRTVLVQSNSAWQFLKGTAEASTPVEAWRQTGFNDASWIASSAPFYYGDPYAGPDFPGTLLGDMQGLYTSVYLRQPFFVPNVTELTNLYLHAQSDDGFIAWINGIEVLRYNMASGEMPANATAVNSVAEIGNTAAAIAHALPSPQAYLMPGSNVLAVHAFNQSLAGSSDFGFNAQLYTFFPDRAAASPRVVRFQPPGGEVFHLTNVTIQFSEEVTGVGNDDVFINGIASTTVSGGGSNSVYTFGLAQPPYGDVSLSWGPETAIVDFDSPPKAFDGRAPGATIRYTLLNPNAPAVGSQAPPAGATLSTLTELSVTFTKPVTGVDATDLLVNGAPASRVDRDNATYIFTFAQPAYGNVVIGWAADHGIQDLSTPPNVFSALRSANRWSYALVDQAKPTVVSQNPIAGARVTNLTQVTVTFSESVTGLNAADLLINGIPAASLDGAGSVYTFQFEPVEATVLNISWSGGHGIRDRASLPNSFEATASGSTWQYVAADTSAPRIDSIVPPPFAALRSLSHIVMTFTEPVAGLDTNALRINGHPARSLVGSGAGPYTFGFVPAAAGPVEVSWASAHNIRDLASPPNVFAGSPWSYHLDPTASFAGKVVINEIMLHPPTGAIAEEWLELHNLSTKPVPLAGWRFTRGIDLRLPNISLPPSGYLVVAANANAFATLHPGVINVVGGWSGRLANSDETIELVTAFDETVDSVHYATEGEWAVRYRSGPARRVQSLTRLGNVATLTVPGHGYSNGEQVFLTGADQPAYNGRFVLSGVTPSTFNIAVAGTPPSPATGVLICRLVLDNNATGWSWFSAADGFGSSLELINPFQPLATGQNWSPSMTQLGTPGGPNSVRRTNAAPVILDPKHSPPVPRSTDSIRFSASVRDELSNGVANVTLFFRNHSTLTPPSFSSATLFDDGQHDDGRANDGLFATTLEPQFNGRVLEYYFQANDNAGNVRTWPTAAWQTNDTFGQYANALLQIDDEMPSMPTPMPFLRVVLTETERSILAGMDANSDAEMNATFISVDGEGTKVRPNSGFRIRGAGTRSGSPKNYRLNIPTDNRWNGLNEINLNSRYIHAQLAGSALAQKAGLPAADARVVQLRINTRNPAPAGTPVNGNGSLGGGFGCYLLVEAINGDWAAQHFPLDGEGNVYRASSGGHAANFAYGGSSPDFYLGRGFSKTSNQGDNDWNDLVNLSFALSNGLSDDEYVDAVRTNLHVQGWMRYFAVCTFLGFGETALCNGKGDDFALYRGVNDPRFRVLAHDFDTILGQGDTTTAYPTLASASIWVMLNPPNPNADVSALLRLMTHPEFAPIYFQELQRLADTAFSSAEAGPLLDQILGGWGPNALTIAAMKNSLATRRINILGQIPATLTIGHSLGVSNGLAYTTTSSVTLAGQAPAIETRQVRVNGAVATWSAWEARWTHTASLQPGINRLLVQSLDGDGREVARATLDFWFAGGPGQSIAGTLANDTAWNAAGGPYNITGTLTIGPGTTLTIQPGTTLYLAPGASLVIAAGGRLLAEGTDEARIRISRFPGSSAAWGGVVVNGGIGSPETRITYTHLEGNGMAAIRSSDGTVFLDHLTFGTTDRPYLSLDRSSFTVSGCIFPNATAPFELVHGSGGLKSSGRGLFLRNFFGVPIGYNDVVDFTGGQRPGPIVHFLNNVFMGATDDILDLDGTDAWIEGNIFLHAHQNGSPDSASAVSGGSEAGQTSEITIIGNIFYDVDQAVTAKQGNFYTLVNNTIVHQTKVGGTDTDAGVVNLADAGAAEAAGLHLEGNIIRDAEKLVRNLTAASVTFSNNFLPAAWFGAGGGNVTNDPGLNYVPDLSETFFSSWQSAQVMRTWFGLRPGSPAIGAGPNRRDAGGVVPGGISIAGEPASQTPWPAAVLGIGVNRSIPSAGWPAGAGFTHYRWRLDAGPWSAEIPVSVPILLTGLADGPHSVEAVGRRDSGLWQDDAVFGPDALTTRSRSWLVKSDASPIQINEVLASNLRAFDHFGTTPDAIEFCNLTPVTLDLGGMGLTDDPEDPVKFLFPPGATIAANGFLVVFANNADGTPGYHLGFNLNQAGDALYLFDTAARGRRLLDSSTFGLQVRDYSIGRFADGTWSLNRPTLGAVNQAALLGSPFRLRINEWLALSTSAAVPEFVELHNPEPWPVAIGGFYWSDAPLGWPDRHRVPSLSYAAPFAYQRFVTDGNESQGADHLNFRLSAEQGQIAIFAPDQTWIDGVIYGPQHSDVAQGRSPNGSDRILVLGTPTPGSPNPLGTTVLNGGALVINEVLAANASVLEPDGRTPDWIEIYNGTTNTVRLEDMSLSDDATVPRRFIFAPDTLLAPGAFWRVRCDDGQPGATNNASFGLRAKGGTVYLFDRLSNGGGLLSAINYGLQAPDFSIGRVPDGSTNWMLNLPSPDGANLAAALGPPSTLKVNEWMADPVSGDDWFELYNPGSQPIPLGGLHLSDDWNNRGKHRIAPLSFIGTGTNGWQQFIADDNAAAGPDHTAFALKAGGEAIILSGSGGALIDGLTFGPQQAGISEGLFPDGAASLVRFPGTASPGQSNWRWLTNVVINEVLTRTADPFEDAIELRNLTLQAVDLGGWWFSDDMATLQKYQIPFGTILPANGFLVFYESQFTNQELAAVPFSLSSRGDEAVLSASANNVLTGFRTAVRFGAARNGISFGRHVTSDGRDEFVAMSARSFGSDDPGSLIEFRQGTGVGNPLPLVGPVVISEIQFHPPDLGAADNTHDEFIELRNITALAVPLFDPAHRTNVWRLREAIDFDFPPGTTLAANGTLVVASFDPVANPAALAHFREIHQIGANVTILGPYAGKLANDTDQLELRRPDEPTGEEEPPYVLVERVAYSDRHPWPLDADGNGNSLQRVALTGFGNDPIHWRAALPTPGRTTNVGDADEDGLPDVWEIGFGFNPLDAADAAFDADGDGLTNLQEYTLATNPRDSRSGLRLDITILATQPSGVVLQFTALSNHAYTVQHRLDLLGGGWLDLTNFSAQPTIRGIQVIDPIRLGVPQKFYRLLMPFGP